MSLLSIFFIAVALSFDVLAVCAAGGASEKHISFYEAFRAALFFGFSQALAPLIGFLVGVRLEYFISSFDHWVAFLLLSILGLKMFIESLDQKKEKTFDMHDPKILFLLSLATGVDALVAGITFAFLPVSIWLAIAIIGSTTLIIALFSILLGHKFGKLWGRKVEILGGLILIVIGLKILLSHLLG